MLRFIRNFAAKRLERMLLAAEVDSLVEERYAAQWWQTVLDMRELRDEAAELEELLLEAQFAEDWIEYAKVQANQQHVRDLIIALLPNYTAATIELVKRDYALPV